MSDDPFDVQPPAEKLTLEFVPVPCQRHVEPELPDPIDGLFEEFWRTYPRKGGKQTARGRYAKAVREGAEPVAILAAAQAFHEFCTDTGREQQFIRHAERWLQEKPWESGEAFIDRPKRQPRRAIKVPDATIPTRDAEPEPQPVVFYDAPESRHGRQWAQPRPHTPSQEVKRRAEVIAQAYCTVQPLSNPSKVRQVVLKAFATKRWADAEIRAALFRLAKTDRKVTEETLRQEILYRISEHRRRDERPDPKETSVVYLIKADESPLVKIGTSEVSLSRLYSLQLSCPVELKILHEISGSYELETALHDEFKSRRKHGEWFDFSDVDPVEAVTRRLPHVLKRLEQARVAATSTPIEEP